MRLEGKVAIVTGGARNIGAVYSKRLAEEGARVVGGAEAIALTIDVSKENDTLRMAEETVKRFGRIDILVNNAAIFLSIQRRTFNEISVEEWDQVMAVNVKGPFLCAKAVLPEMKKQESGKIINITSTTALAGTPLFLHYVTSKAALIGMTRSLAREMGKFGICVNAIAPGLVEHEGQTAPKEFTEFQLKARAIKRLEVPEDLTGALVYLASSDSDFITGQTLVVDGGSVLH
jgi:NAD(P)-dependent dehydrogenase (short-subunit alcohol dehydrogenase family)